MRPRMYGSTDMNVLRTTISPSPGSGTSTSASSKLDGSGSPDGRDASRISLLVRDMFHLDTVVMKDRAAAHVGVALLHGGVDVGPATDVLEPVPLGRGDHACPHAVGDH